VQRFIICQKILDPRLDYEVSLFNDKKPLYVVQRDSLGISTNILSLRETIEGSILLILKSNFMFKDCLLLKATGGECGRIHFEGSLQKQFQLNFEGEEYHGQGGLWAWRFEGFNAKKEVLFVIQRRPSFKLRFELNLKDGLPFAPLILTTIAISHRYYK